MALSLDHAIETPENVVLTYTLAGPSARCLAYLVDLLIRAALLMVVMFVLSILFAESMGLLIGSLMLTMFFLEWGYTISTEYAFGGRTPGKHLCGLRVIHENGQPLTWWGATLRNLLRVGDSLPFLLLYDHSLAILSIFPVYGPGMVAMLLSPRLQRLGDLAARTIVIREHVPSLPRDPVIYDHIQPLPSNEINSLRPHSSTLTLIDQFLSRRSVLTYQRGHELAGGLATSLAERLDYQGDRAAVAAYPMAFLARVYVTFTTPRGLENGEANGAAKPAESVRGREAAGSRMSKQQFLERRRVAWKQFERLLDRKGTQGRGRFNPEEVQEFSRLLREVSDDLAIIRSRDWGQGLVAFLNPLLARGYNAFYRAQPANWWRCWEFLALDFPRMFRRNAGYFFVAAALFFIPLAVTWAAVQIDPTRGLRVLPAEVLDQVDRMYSTFNDHDTDDDDEDDSEDADKDASAMSGTPDDDDDSKKDQSDELDPEIEPFDPSEAFGEERAAMAGFYVRNNVGIALQCFSRGVLLGLGTMFTLLYNGVVIGAIAGYVLAQGHTERFLSFVVSHGSFELTAIAVAGGAGLILGDAFIHAGQRTRLESLRVRGLEATQLAAGAAIMLMIAALIEAFWSPAPIAAQTKYLVGGGLWLVVALYLGLSGARR